VLYDNIQKAPLKMPKSITPEAKDIILKVNHNNFFKFLVIKKKST